MEVVSTSNLVSSENEKKQQLVIFKKAKSEPMHICKHQAIRNFMMVER